MARKQVEDLISEDLAVFPTTHSHLWTCSICHSRHIQANLEPSALTGVVYQALTCFAAIPYIPSDSPALVQVQLKVLLTLSMGRLISWLPGFKSRPFLALQPGHTHSDVITSTALLKQVKKRVYGPWKGNHLQVLPSENFVEAWSIVTIFLKDNW